MDNSRFLSDITSLVFIAFSTLGLFSHFASLSSDTTSVLIKVLVVAGVCFAVYFAVRNIRLFYSRAFVFLFDFCTIFAGTASMFFSRTANPVIFGSRVFLPYFFIFAMYLTLFYFNNEALRVKLMIYMTAVYSFLFIFLSNIEGLVLLNIAVTLYAAINTRKYFLPVIAFQGMLLLLISLVVLSNDLLFRDFSSVLFSAKINSGLFSEISFVPGTSVGNSGSSLVNIISSFGLSGIIFFSVLLSCLIGSFVCGRTGLTFFAFILVTFVISLFSINGKMPVVDFCFVSNSMFTVVFNAFVLGMLSKKECSYAE